MNIKRKIVAVCSILLLFSMVACSNKNNKEHSVILKGTFLLNPEDALDLSEEDLESSQKLLLIVYDVLPNKDENEETNTFNDAVSINCNEINEYEQLGVSDLTTFNNFVKNSGYKVSSEVDTIWGGDSPVRMIAVFAINENDLNENFSAEINFDLSDNIKDEWNITNEDIKEITLYDEVFSIEEKPDLYQVSRSILARNEWVCRCIQSSAISWENGDIDGLNLAAAEMQTMYSEEATWGVSCGLDYSNVIISSETLSTYTQEALKLLDAETAKAEEDFIKNVNELVTMLSNPGEYSGQEVSNKMNEIMSQKDNIRKLYGVDE